MIARWLRWVHPGVLVMYLILAGAAGVVCYGLVGIVRGLDITLLLPFALLGLCVGALISRAQRRSGWGLLVAALLGALFLCLITGGLSGKLLAVAGAFLEDAYRYGMSGFSASPVFSATQLAYGAFMQGVAGVIARFSTWLGGIRGGDLRFDPLIPSLAWGWGTWLASLWAGWAVNRGLRAFAVLLPFLLILGGGLGLVRGNPGLLIALLGCLAGLAPLVSQINRERSWQSRQVDYSLETRFDLATSAIPLVLLIVGMATLTYLVPWEEVFQPHPRASVQASNQSEHLASSFGLTLPTRVPTALDPYLAPGLPLRHLIGSGPELSQQVVMKVGLAEPGDGAFNAEPLYWRAFTYDRYLGSGWATSGVELVNYASGQLVSPAASANFLPLSLRVEKIKTPGGILYFPGQLKDVNQGITIQRRSDGDIFGGYVRQNEYRVEAYINAAPVAALRQAGAAYPAWVKNRYLALPQNIPNRVISLALEVTSPYGNVYDRAKALESYLRTYPYTLDLPAPPEGRDIADYFLFDLKQGYCDYYATAMVVLARAAGIPARLVVGYASGQWDATLQEYTVRASDGHSWVEVYFPEYGWVEFEPTAGSPVESGRYANMQPPSYVMTPSAGENSGRAGVDALRNIPWGWLAFGILPLAFGGWLWQVVQDRRIENLPPLKALTLIYRRLSARTKRLGLRENPAQTPYELVEAVLQRLAGFTHRKGLGKVLLPVAAEL